MIIICDKCKTKFNIKDSIIPDEGADFKCTKCANLLHLKKESKKEKIEVKQNIEPAKAKLKTTQPLKKDLDYGSLFGDTSPKKEKENMNNSFDDLFSSDFSKFNKEISIGKVKDKEKEVEKKKDKELEVESSFSSEKKDEYTPSFDNVFSNNNFFDEEKTTVAPYSNKNKNEKKFDNFSEEKTTVAPYSKKGKKVRNDNIEQGNNEKSNDHESIDLQNNNSKIEDSDLQNNNLTNNNLNNQVTSQNQEAINFQGDNNASQNQEAINFQANNDSQNQEAINSEYTFEKIFIKKENGPVYEFNKESDFIDWIKNRDDIKSLLYSSDNTNFENIENYSLVKNLNLIKPENHFKDIIDSGEDKTKKKNGWLLLLSLLLMLILLVSLGIFLHHKKIIHISFLDSIFSKNEPIVKQEPKKEVKKVEIKKVKEIKEVTLKETGKIVLLEGMVFVKNKDKDKFVKINEDSKINIGDIIKTLKKSNVSILFDDNSLVTVLENSKLEVKKYEYAKNNRNVELNFISGKIKSWVSKIGDNEEKNYKIKTPTMTVGIRGTRFIISLEPQKVENTENTKNEKPQKIAEKQEDKKNNSDNIEINLFDGKLAVADEKNPDLKAELKKNDCIVLNEKNKNLKVAKMDADYIKRVNSDFESIEDKLRKLNLGVDIAKEKIEEPEEKIEEPEEKKVEIKTNKKLTRKKSKYHEARRALDEGNYYKARNLFFKLALSAPKDSEAYGALSVIYGKLHDQRNSKNFKSAYKALKNNRRNRTMPYIKLQELSRIVCQAPNDLPVCEKHYRYITARKNLSLKRYDEAKINFIKLALYYPSDSEAYGALSIIYKALGEQETANKFTKAHKNLKENKKNTDVSPDLLKSLLK